MVTSVRRERIGQFLISDILILEADRRGLRVLMSQLVPVRVEHLYFKRAFHYLAYSDLFDEVSEGADAPWYTLEILKFGADRFDIKAVRCEKPLF